MGFSATLLVLGIMLGARGAGQIPSLGRFLDPIRGLWAVARNADLSNLEAVIPSLDGPVSVVFDERAVPHIFATTSMDAARALGYVVARDRLLQMELQTRATAGTLTEIAGPGLLRLDQDSRRLGMAASADSAFANLDQESRSTRQVTAYAEGVNAWIDNLDESDYPFEYRLIGRAPQRWEPVYTLYLLRQMGRTLAGYAPDLNMERAVALIGAEAAAVLFPRHAPIQEPIQPDGANSPRFDLPRIPPPPVRGSMPASAATPIALDGWSLNSALPDRPVEASNNWVVSGTRTSSGNALLAGDPHLDLSLPSIWYEAHIVVPGELDVYGVTFPGVPGIIIGFNRRVAWSFTNTGADVMDFYDERIDDFSTPTRYWLDGEWRPLGRRLETYRDGKGNVIAVDTLYSTHRGPLRIGSNRALSMRWTVLESASELEAFDRLVRADNVEEWIDAMRLYRAPAQNGVVADVDGNVALESFGWFPVRPGDGNGLEVRNGTTSASDWIGEWPFGEYPGAVNPEQGFLASANQEPIDPVVNENYLGSDWITPWRAMRINRLLRDNDTVTVGDMRAYQTDPGSARADYFVPVILSAVAAAVDTSEAGLAREILRTWDRQYLADSRGAVLFEWTMDRLVTLTWDELVPPGATRRVDTPGESLLAALFQDPANRWWDLGSTNTTERRDDIVATALGQAYRDVVSVLGEPGPGWEWRNVGQANIYHLFQFESMSRLGIPVQAGIGTLGAWSRSGRHGPSWRMVVDMDPDGLRAWSTYPGGQSGNPVSQFYDDRISEWAHGELHEVLFPSESDGLGADRIVATFTLKSTP